MVLNKKCLYLSAATTKPVTSVNTLLIKYVSYYTKNKLMYRNSSE